MSLRHAIWLHGHGMHQVVLDECELGYRAAACLDEENSIKPYWYVEVWRP